MSSTPATSAQQGESRKGSATPLRAHSLAAEAQPAGGIEDPSSYDAFVVGSAVHGGRWLREATEFTRRHHELLAERPVWLFSTGPVGERFVQAQQPDPREVVGLRRKILPRDHRVFAGAFERDTADPTSLSLIMRTVVRAFLPSGDFRDWPQIEAWAHSIALELKAAKVGARQTTGRSTDDQVHRAS